jgi:hypothetical protein
MKKTREAIFFYIGRALLGEVFPALRLVQFEFDGESIFVDYYVDGEIAEQDAESISCAETELLADLDADTAVVTRIHCVPATEAIPKSERAVTVFHRRE